MQSLFVNETAIRKSLQQSHPWCPDDLLDHALQVLIDDCCRQFGIEQVGTVGLLLTDLFQAPEDADYITHAAMTLGPGPGLFQSRLLTDVEIREVDGVPADSHYKLRWARGFLSDRNARMYARHGLIGSISKLNQVAIQTQLRHSPPSPRPLPQESRPVRVTTSPNAAYQLVSPATEDAFLAELAFASRLGMDTETTFVPGWDANPEKKAVRRRWDQVVGISVATRTGSGWYLPAGLVRAPHTPVPRAFQAIERALKDRSLPKVGHNLPFDMQALQQSFGIEVQGPLHDTQVLSWLLGAESGHQGLKERAYLDLGIRMIEYNELAKGRDMADVPPEEAAPYAGADADIPLRLMDLKLPEINAQGMDRAYQIEQRVTRILHKLSWKGMYLDTEAIEPMLERVDQEIAQLQGDWFPGINIRSSKQLSQHLYRDCGYVVTDPTKRRTNKEWATDGTTIKELLFQYEGDQKLMALLQLRGLMQHKSLFLKKLPGLVNPVTRRIHSSFKQTNTRTWRLAGSDPNLMQISARSALGKELRQAFKGQDGNQLLVGDLAQIEGRILAHLSQDPGLIRVFTEGLDLWSYVTSQLYSVPMDQVTKYQRQAGKQSGLATQYGAYGHKISQASLDPLADPPFYISPEDAQRNVDAYFLRFPGIQTLMKQSIGFAKQHGYIVNELGYRRELPEITHYDSAKRMTAERQANNTPNQGLAGALFKLILIALEDAGLLDFFVNIVHDELVGEGTEAELREIMPLVKQIMESAYQLTVPVIAELGIGPSWIAAKG